MATPKSKGKKDIMRSQHSMGSPRWKVIPFLTAVLVAAATLLSFALSPLGSAKAAQADDMLCDASTTTSLDSYVTALTITKNGSTVDSGTAFNAGDSGKLLLQYKIPPTDLSATQCKFTYQIPNKYIGTPEQSGSIASSDGNSVGQYTIDANGLLTLTFAKTFASGDGTANGNIIADFTIKANNSGQQQDVVIPGGNNSTTIVIPPTSADTGIDVGKTAQWTNKWDPATNSTKINYTTIVSTNHADGSADTISIVDQLAALPTGIKSESYDTTSFVVKDASGATVSSSNYTLTVDNGATPPKFSLTGLPKLAQGGKYTITYDVTATASNLNGSTNIGNNVTATSGSNSPKASANPQISRNVLSKSAESGDGIVKWTITLNNDRAMDLTNFKLTDTLTQILNGASSDASSLLPDTMTLTDTSDTNVQPITVNKSDLLSKALGDLLPAGHMTDSWTVTYQTKAVAPGVGQTVSYSNTANGTDGGDTYTGTGTGQSSTGTDTFALAKWTNTKLDFSNATSGTVTWNSDLNLPQSGLPKGATYVDTLAQCANGSNKKVVCNSFDAATDAAFQTLTLSGDKGNSKLQRGTDYTISYANATTATDGSTTTYTPVNTAVAGWKADTFIITFNAISYAADSAKKISLQYTSEVDASGLAAGTTINFCNAATAKVADVSKAANSCTSGYVPSGEPSMEKKSGASDGTFWSSWNTLNYQADSKNQTMQYRIRFNTNAADHASGDHTIVDTLPEGTSYVDGSMSALFNDKDATANVGGKQVNASDLVQVVSYDAAARKITFKVLDGYGSNEIGITYTVSYASDPKWTDLDPYQNQSETYQNSASLDGGTPSQATVVVKYTGEKKIAKTGHQDGTNHNKVYYSVVVNPEGKKLLTDSPDGKITVTDVMSGDANTSTNTLVDGSLAVYTYDPSNTSGDHRGSLVPAGSYASSYDKASRTLKVTLNDGKAYVVTYAYFVTASTTGTIAGTFKLSNSVTINGVSGASDGNQVSYASSSGSAVRAVLTFNKIDDSKKPVGAGASFLLEKFDGSKWVSDGSVQPMQTSFGDMTNSNGVITTDRASLIKFDLGADQTFTPGTLYRLTETAAPDGYRVNVTPNYFSVNKLPTSLPDGIGANDVSVVKSADGYESDITDVATTKVSVTKSWNDANDQDGARPASVEAQLMANGVATGDPVTLDASNNWTHSWTDLAKYSGSDPISYSVSEVKVPGGYESGVVESSPGNWTITNTHAVATTVVSGSKSWDDNDDQDGARPSAVTVNLLADGVKVASRTVDARSGWKYSFADLPVFKAGASGQKVVYTVTEDAVKDYVSTVSGFDVTNTHKPGLTGVSVTKSWDDANDQDGIRPGSVQVQLKADGVSVGDPVSLDAASKWTHAWSDLPVFKAGQRISYSVSEVKVPGGYESGVVESSPGNWTITNTHTPKKNTPAVPQGPQPKDSTTGVPQLSATGAAVSAVAGVGAALLLAAGTVLALIKKKKND